MRPKRKIDSRQVAIAAIALMAGCAALRCGAMVGFDADYDAAMARAKERGKPLFALFTGSDWCVWCKRLDAEVFSKPEFLDVATNAYELAVLDFPMDDSRQSAAERKRNEKLSERFKVKGYPTVLLIDAKDGTELYRAGYERGGAKAWIESFQKGAELKPLHDKHLKPFEDELRAEFTALAVECKAVLPPEGKAGDYAKMATEVKASAQKHLPALRSIRERLAAAEVPAVLDKSKAEMLAALKMTCEQCEGLAKKEVAAIAAEMEEAEKRAAEMREKLKREYEDRSKKERKEREEREGAWLKDWSENIRTNMSIETCASFRETHLRPFALAEMDPDGKATEAERRILNASIDHVWGIGGFRAFKDAKKLVEILDRTAKKPFAAFVAAFVQKKNVVGPMVEWLKSGNFSGEDMRSVFWMLRNNGGFNNAKVLAGIEKAQVDEWLKLLWRIEVERRAAWKARGGGWASSVTKEGWDGFEKHGDACRKAFARAMELHSFPEPMYLFAYLRPFDDRLFTQMTALQADFIQFYDNYLWFSCYPRWCGSHEKMKAFAERCYATGRHDTMVPYFYAETLLKMVRDMNVSVEKYFGEHAGELDKIIEVSQPQIANTNAFGEVRQCAGVFATLAYCLKGDYEKASESWRPFRNSQMSRRVWSCVDGLSRWWMIFDGISGLNHREFQRLNSLYRVGDYAGFVRGVDELRKRDVALDGGEMIFAERLGLSARMKTDFQEGKPVSASFQRNREQWLSYGSAWRVNETYACYDGKYKPGYSLEWVAAVPGEFRMECEIAPNGEKKEWHFEFQFKPADPALANKGIDPYLSLKFAAGKCDLAFGEWKDVYKNNSAEKAIVDYAGGSIRLVVTYKAGKASIILGDGETPVLETEAHSDMLKQIAEGLVRFNGSGAKLLSMKVMRPSAGARPEGEKR